MPAVHFVILAEGTGRFREEASILVITKTSLDMEATAEEEILRPIKVMRQSFVVKIKR
jgi:hypothetical protein